MNGRVLQLLGLCLVGGACGADPRGAPSTHSPLAACDVVDGSACPAVVPSFANDVLPVLNRECNATCHAPAMGQWPLVDYSDVSAWASLITLDVADCAMPPADAGALTSTDRSMVLGWITCGAPNN